MFFVVGSCVSKLCITKGATLDLLLFVKIWHRCSSVGVAALREDFARKELVCLPSWPSTQNRAFLGILGHIYESKIEGQDD